MSYLKTFSKEINQSKGIKGAIVAAVAMVGFAVAQGAIAFARHALPDLPISEALADTFQTGASAVFATGAAYAYERARNFIKHRMGF